MGTPEQRFWAHVDKNGPVPSVDPKLGPCWLWTGPKERSGHGRIRISTAGERDGAHRFAYQLLLRVDPGELFVCHRCDNPPCVNPDHLFLGTHQDNMSDRDSKMRHCHGSRSPNTRLTEATVLEIRRLYATGEHSQESLAKRFRLGQVSVSRLLLRKTWQHI
jgi:hypothetical protein